LLARVDLLSLEEKEAQTLSYGHQRLLELAMGLALQPHILILVHAVTFLIGLALLVFVIYRIGYQSLLDSLATVGWGFLLILGLNVCRHFMRAASLYWAVAPDHRNFRYRNAVAARFGGEAVNFFSFAGPFLGDATRAVLLKRNIPLSEGASAVIIDNILYYVTVIMMVPAGVAVLLVN